MIMMNERQLLAMRKLVNAALVDCDFLSVDEIKDLRATIDAELYVQQIKSFRRLLDNLVPEATDSADSPEWDDFYDTDWRIQFGPHTVTIHNEALMYDGIRSLLDDYIKNSL